MVMSKAEKAAHQKLRNQAQRIRAMARRQAYELVKVRRIDRNALDYGTYQLWDGEQKVNDAGKRLDDIEAFLLSGPRKAQQVRVSGRGK